MSDRYVVKKGSPLGIKDMEMDRLVALFLSDRKHPDAAEGYAGFCCKMLNKWAQREKERLATKAVTHG